MKYLKAKIYKPHEHSMFCRVCQEITKFIWVDEYFENFILVKGHYECVKCGSRNVIEKWD